MPKYEQGGRRLIPLVMSGLAVWGAVLSLGALLFGYDSQERQVTISINPVRGLIVAGCVSAFIVFWAAMLAARRRRT